MLNYDGRVIKCTAIDFEETKEDGFLNDDGDIQWGNSLAHKIVKATFENEVCEKCSYLPVCFGPCSKKTAMANDANDFRKYCFESGMEETLNHITKEFYKTGQSLDQLKNYF